MTLKARLRARVGRLALEVNLETGPGTLALVGPNGAGKSSVLSLILGARLPDDGRVEASGSVLYDAGAGVNVPLERRRLGYVPQDYALFPHLSVRDNVAFALTSAEPHLERRVARERVARLLDELGLESQAERRPATLSGGERQRLALARALALGPRALLLDEPLAALDVQKRAKVRHFLATTLERLALPTILVTHDPLDARLLGTRVAVLEDGRITQLGSFSELAERPQSSFVEEFVRTAGG